MTRRASNKVEKSDTPSKGGVPAPTQPADLLALDDGQLGAAIVSILSADSPRHSNFAALGSLVRLGANGLGELAEGYLAQILRRPGKHRKL